MEEQIQIATMRDHVVHILCTHSLPTFQALSAPRLPDKLFSSARRPAVPRIGIPAVPVC